MQGVFDAHQLQARGGVGLGVAGRRDLAVAEVALGEADATHLQVSRSSGSKRWPMMNSVLPPPMSATRRLPGCRPRCGHTQVDQARLFAAGDDLDRVPEDGFGTLDEFVAVARFAQGIGTDDAHRASRHAVDQLGKALEAVQAPLHRSSLSLRSSSMPAAS